ncbi:MAG: CCA tRNA nucleotidyltransferase [Caldicoprobacterales bacterium]|jgi:tRNA nucleotidyltransferase (CCA-adding enzyme)|nr:hypothetical protein [Clostridiales bacterium]
MNLPETLEYIMKKIMDAGGQVYLVGGALRDRLLGKPVTDYDLASSFPPDRIQEIFSAEKTWPSGKRFGTVTVMKNDISVEITTFREESVYTDSRHPDRVVYVSDIRRDLARRDFTINAMAYNPYHAEVFIDPFSGRKDLENRIIRAVGSPVERFNEDPLRIMRGLRLAAQLNFEIHQETLEAMRACYRDLNKVSAERLRTELDRLLLSPHPDKGLLLLDELGILSLLLQVKDARLDVQRTQIIKSIQPYLIYRFAALLFLLYFERDTTLPFSYDFWKNTLTRLRYDNKTIFHILNMLRSCFCFPDMEITPFTIRKLCGRMGAEDTRQILELHKELQQIRKSPNMTDKLQEAELLLKWVIDRNEPVFFHQLAINGNDVLQAGIGTENGRIVGEALNLAYEWVLENPALNQRDCLIMKLKEHYNSLQETSD